MPDVPQARAGARASSAPARVVLLTLALLAAGWLVVSLRDVRLESRASALLRDRPPDLVDARRRLESARLLNASSSVDQTLAAVSWLEGDRRTAIARLQSVVRREPDNRVAWSFLARFAAETDPRRSREAARRAAALDGLRSAR